MVLPTAKVRHVIEDAGTHVTYTDHQRDEVEARKCCATIESRAADARAGFIFLKIDQCISVSLSVHSSINCTVNSRLS
jgi:hypothetical protein